MGALSAGRHFNTVAIIVATIILEGGSIWGPTSHALTVSTETGVRSTGDSRPYLVHFLRNDATKLAYVRLLDYTYDDETKWYQSLIPRKCCPWLTEKKLFSRSFGGPLSYFHTYDPRVLARKLKDFERIVKRDFMTQSSHSRDRTGRDGEDVPRYAQRCMEYLDSL